MKLYIINGKAGSGKDAFCELVSEMYKASRPEKEYIVDNTLDPVTVLHSSDSAKEALTLLGWDGERTSEVRELLAQLTQFGQHHGVTEKLINGKYNRYRDVVFFHERDPKEIDRIKQMLADENILAGACDTLKTIFIMRDVEDVEEDIWDIKNYKYDYVIDNRLGGIEALRGKVKQFLIEEGLVDE